VKEGKMPAVKVGDVSIYYEMHGDGECLVLISGMGGNTTMWQWAIPIFSPKFRMVTFDARGSGQSDKPDIPYTMEMMADDLAELLDAIDIDAAHILGLSMGGMIAQHFALSYSKRVKSLILGCTSCGGPRVTMLCPEVMKVYDMFRVSKLTPQEFITESVRLGYTQDFLHKNPGLVQQTTAAMTEHPIPADVWIHYVQALMNHDTFDYLSEIKAPTLVIHGDGDRCVPVENARILAARIPRSELVIFKNTGHMFAEEGREFVRAILEFLDR
jgi:3-oxoadipate enol-lactonase